MISNIFQSEINQILFRNLIRIFKKSCRLTYTFEYTFSAVHAGAFVFMQDGMPKKFRPDLKKISNRNLTHFVSTSDPNTNIEKESTPPTRVPTPPKNARPPLGSAKMPVPDPLNYTMDTSEVFLIMNFFREFENVTK